MSEKVTNSGQPVARLRSGAWGRWCSMRGHDEVEWMFDLLRVVGLARGLPMDKATRDLEKAKTERFSGSPPTAHLHQFRPYPVLAAPVYKESRVATACLSSSTSSSCQPRLSQ